jgi:uncharacterized membrane protein
MAAGRTGETADGQSSAELVRARLDRARRVWRRMELLAVLLRGMGILLAIFLSALALDNLLRLPGFVRLAFGLAFIVGGVYLLGIKLLHRLARRRQGRAQPAGEADARPLRGGGGQGL